MSSSSKLEEASDRLPLVLLLRPLLPAFNAALSPRFRFLKPWESPIPIDDFFSIHGGSVRVLLCSGHTPVEAATIGKLPRLELVVASSAGLNHIDTGECRRRGIVVTNAGDAFADDCADYAVGLLIDVMRGVSAGDRYVRQGLWPVNGEFRLGSKVEDLI